MIGLKNQLGGASQRTCKTDGAGVKHDRNDENRFENCKAGRI
jgi:hypothetical protein